MTLWITAGVAAGLWCWLMVLMIGRFRRNNRLLERGRIDQDVREMFDTPENIHQRMIDTPGDPVPAIKWALLGEGDAFEARMRQVLARFPTLQQPNLFLARRLLANGDLRGVKPLSRRLLRLYPGDFDAVALAVELAVAEGQWPRARSLAKRLRKMHSYSIHSFRAAFTAYLAMDDLDAAQAVLVEAEQEFGQAADVADLWDRLEERLAADGAPPQA